MDTNKKPYGAWVTPDGELIPVIEAMCHMETAQAILGLSGDKTGKKYPLYAIMYRLHYLRLTYSAKDYNYMLEYKEGQKITDKQTQFVDMADVIGFYNYRSFYS
jgi:hypothetical protein